jgi:hypothetical protein
VCKIGETEDARQAKTSDSPRISQPVTNVEMERLERLDDWSCRLSANGLNVWNYLNAKRLPSP